MFDAAAVIPFRTTLTTSLWQIQSKLKQNILIFLKYCPLLAFIPVLDQNDSQLSNTFLVYNMFSVEFPHWWPCERHKIDFLCTWFGHPYRGETCLCLNIFTMSINITPRNTCQIINWKISRTFSKRGGKWEVFFGTKISGRPFQQNIPAMSAFPISASDGFLFEQAVGPMSLRRWN